MSHTTSSAVSAYAKRVRFNSCNLLTSIRGVYIQSFSPFPLSLPSKLMGICLNLFVYPCCQLEVFIQGTKTWRHDHEALSAFGKHGLSDEKVVGMVQFVHIGVFNCALFEGKYNIQANTFPYHLLCNNFCRLYDCWSTTDDEANSSIASFLTISTVSS